MRSDTGAFSSSASSVSELDALVFTVSGMTLHVTNLSMNLRFSHCGFFKNQADLAVVRVKTSIQTAKDFFDFCNENLIQPKSDGCKRRIFIYIETIPPRQ
jgi:hypothetical protein